MVQIPNFCFWVEIFPWYPLNMGNLFQDQLGLTQNGTVNQTLVIKAIRRVLTNICIFVMVH